MTDARRYAVWPEPRSRSRSLKGSRPSVPHGTNFLYYQRTYYNNNNLPIRHSMFMVLQFVLRLFTLGMPTVRHSSVENF